MNIKLDKNQYFQVCAAITSAVTYYKNCAEMFKAESSATDWRVRLMNNSVTELNKVSKDMEESVKEMDELMLHAIQFPK